MAYKTSNSTFIRALLFCSVFGLAVRGQAQALIWANSDAVDAVSQHPFTLNPAYAQSKNSTATLGLSLRPAEHLQTSTPDSGTTDSTTAPLTAIGIGLRKSLAQDVAFGLDASYANAMDTNGSYTSRFIALHLTLPLTNSFKIGLVGNGMLVDATKERFKNDVVSDMSGHLFGVGGGIFWGEKGHGLGVTYIPTLNGTASAEGETKTLALPGIIAADATFPISGSSTLGLTVRKWDYDSAKNADATLGAFEFGDAMPPNLMAGLGWYGSQGSWFHRGMASREYYGESNTEATSVPTSVQNFEGKTRLKLSLGREKDGVETSLGLRARWAPDGDKNGDTTVKYPAPLAEIQFSFIFGTKL